MLVEQHFSDRSAYPKDSDTATSIDDVQWFAENKGITNLDDPSVKVKTIIDDVNESELARHEAKKAREAKARSEYIDALFNLEEGTAVLRQKTARIKPAKKSTPTTKTVRPAATPKRKYAPRAENKLTFDKEKAAARRMDIMKTLEAGGKVECKHQKDCEGGYAEYQTQYTDIRWLVRVKKLNITRIQRIQDRKSYFVLDNFVRHEMKQTISGGLINADDKARLLTALCSKELVRVSDITTTTKIAARSVASLMRQYELNAYTVFDSRVTEGWVLLDEADKTDAQQKRPQL